MSETKRIYINDKGEITDQPIVLQQEGCDNSIEICRVVTIPDGFTFQFDDFESFSLCTDASDLTCMLENVEVDAAIPNPCGGELTCPVTIDAVRAVGCVRFHVNLGQLIPIQEAYNFNEGCNCTVCVDETVCVNQVIGYTCDQEACAEDCYRFFGAYIQYTSGETDMCGRQTIVVSAGVFLTFAGC